MTDRPVTVRLTRMLVLLNAGIWFVMTIILVAGWHYGIPQEGAYRWIMAFLALLTSVVEVLLLRRLERSRLAYRLLLALLALLAVLSFTDDVGFADMVSMSLALLPFLLLLKDRNWYRAARRGMQDEET